MTLVMFNTLVAGADPTLVDEEFQHHLVTFMDGILALPLPFPWGAYQKGLRSRDWLIDNLLSTVKRRRVEPQKDAISYMIAASDDDGGLSDEQIAAELVHVYFAGFGAMSSNYGYALITLAKHPDIRAKLLAEIEEKTSSEPTLEELQELRYAGQFFKEIMRFYPIVPQTFMGQVIKEMEVGGYHVPAGWKITGVVGASLYDAKRFSRPGHVRPGSLRTGSQ